MDPETQAHLFEPFFTTKGAPGESRVSGTGLGLYISREIVDRHGGAIQIESRLGKGTAVTIILPRENTMQAVSRYGRRGKTQE
jgi:signal transduction histidine kinase